LLEISPVIQYTGDISFQKEVGMKIGMIGAGNIGGTLARKWAAAGHEITFGVRSPQDEKYAFLRSVGRFAATGEAAAFGEVVVLALPGTAAAEIVEQHASALGGKVVVDATNNLRGAEMNTLRLLGERVPSARLARAFSTMGWETMERPQQGGVQHDLFYCAHPDARATVESLIVNVGLRPVYIGDLDMAAALDGMTRVWFALVFAQGKGRGIAFKLID
jgi:8-hydroxy-5-deazaflavin:NADPH oxidoreductase